MNGFNKKQTILIVDDSPLNIQILSDLLGSVCEIVFATGGREALEIARRTLPDLILLDIVMPGMDGYQVCSALKKEPLLADIPVIFITALSDKKDEIRGMQLGAADYITKPFNPDIVKLRVRNHLELKMFRDRYARMSLLDGLTGIPNRRAFDECLNKEWLLAQRNRTELSIILADIDHLKNFNNVFGHLGGDDCLRKVANSLEGSLERGGDFVARYGGEEFACILPNTDLEGAGVTAERMRRSVENMNIPHPDSTAASVVTITLGVATVRPSSDLAADILIVTADRMLSRAKGEGRNRVGR